MAGEEAKGMSIECEKHARLLRDQAKLMQDQARNTILAADNLDREATEMVARASQLPDLIDEAQRIGNDKKLEAQRLRQQASDMQREAQAYDLEAQHMDREAIDLRQLSEQAEKMHQDSVNAARNAQTKITSRKI